MVLKASSKIEFNYEYLTEQGDLDRVKEWLADRKYFGYDIETDGFNPFQNDIIMFQIGNPEKQWLIDTRTINISPLQPYFEDKDWVKLGHGSQFDLKFLMWWHKWRPVKLADTLLAEQVLRCGLGFSVSMEALALHYLGIQIPKDTELRTSFGKTAVGEFSTEQLEYASGDVIYPVYFAKHQKPLIHQRGLRNTLSLEHAVLPVIAEMELAGMRLNKEPWLQLYQEALSHREEQVKILNELFGVEIMHQENMFSDNADVVNELNYNSPAQIKKALEKKGYKFKSTSSDTIALAAIEGELPRDLAAAIIAYRIYSTKVTRYGLNFFDAIEESTGHVHGDFTQCFTSSGRLSSGNKSEDKHQMTRVNLQNIPRDPRYRNCFIPDDGYVYVVYDLQAIEPRILGDMSLDPTYIETFRTDADIYGKIGTQIYHEEVSKKPGKPRELRDKTKIGVLGTSYGTGKNKFYRKMLLDLNRDPEGFLKKELIQITREESDELWEGIFETCPSIRDSLDRSSSLANPLRSNRRVFDERAAKEPYAKVYNILRKMLEEDRFVDPDQVEYLANTYASERGLVTYSESLNGRKRFFKKYHKTWWTEGRNHPIQACLPGDTKILTPEGWIEISSVKDKVTIWTGERWAQASLIISKSAKRLRLYLTDGRTFDCDNNHKLLTYDGVWPEWTPVTQIIGKKLVRDTNVNWGIKKFNVDEWYWAGRIIGDGWISKRGWGISFGPKDQEDAKRFIKFLNLHRENIKGLTNSVRGYNYEKCEYGIKKIYGYTKSAVMFWERLGLVVGAKSRYKRIASIVFTLDYERRKAFFKGYFDSDGCNYHRGVKITSVNKLLLQDTLKLMQTLNLTGVIGKPRTNNHGSIWYDLRIHKIPHDLYVEKIEEVGFEQMYTLSVEDKKHAYSSEGLISKNTAADVVKTAMVHVYQIINKNNYDATIINQAHDELVVQCREDQAEELNPKVKVAMEAAGNKFFRVVTCKATGGIYKKWEKD